MELQLKQQLRVTLMTQIDGWMREYNIPASDIEDAFYYALNSIKDLTIQDLLRESLNKQQELEEKYQEKKKDEVNEQE